MPVSRVVVLEPPTMLRMPPSKPIQFRLTPAQDAALRAWCESRGVNLSDLFRDSALRKIGREDLIGTMPGSGRPKKPEKSS